MEKKKRFNAIDTIIVLFVVVAVIGGVFAIRHFMNSDEGELKTVVVEVTDKKESFSKIVKKDDVAYDGIENVKLGNVVDFKISPAKIDSISALDGTIKKTLIPDRYDILLTLKIPQDMEIQVGKQMWIETTLYKCNGYVIEVNDGGKAAQKK